MADAPLVLVVDGAEVADLQLADTPMARAKGLLGKSGISGAMALVPARSVHTFGMLFSIDVAFLNADGAVIDTTSMCPWRIGLVRRRSAAVLEAQAGSFADWHLEIGSVVSWHEARLSRSRRAA